MATPPSPKKTLLLVFIHGFKGDDTTFLTYPTHLRALLANALPHLHVSTAVYPQYETRGDLAAASAAFRDWLVNRTIDLEVARGTPQPTVEPGVRVVVCGHSMGGIVASEATLGLVREGDGSEEDGAEKKRVLFPCVQGLLAYDTPFLGIAPGVVAYGAEGGWNTGKAWVQTAAGIFGGKATKDGIEKAEQKTTPETPKSLPAAEPEQPASPSPSSTTTSSSPSGHSPSSWQKWGKYAAMASAATAAAAGAGAAAYWKREQISSGWTWAGSHLVFVGTLARGEELRQRVEAVAKLRETHAIGFANLYTCLGKAARVGSPGGVARTFCNLPRDESKVQECFLKAVNDMAEDEAGAHMNMFDPKKNPGYYYMSEHSKELIVSWLPEEWRQPPQHGVTSPVIEEVQAAAGQKSEEIPADVEISLDD